MKHTSANQNHTFSFKQIHLNMLSAKWWPFCLGLDEFTMHDSRTQAHPHMGWLLNKFLCYFLHYWKLHNHGLLFKHPVNFYMMTSSNGDIFHVTGPSCGNPTVTSESPYKDQSQGALMFSLICTWTNEQTIGTLVIWDGDLSHCPHYDVIIMTSVVID